METFGLTAPEKRGHELLQPIILLAVMIAAYKGLQYWINKVDPTSGYIDPSILVLFLLSLIIYLIMIGLSIWLFSRILSIFNLPRVGSMVSQFKTLSVCQQLGFYWASFALLLFAGVMCVMAVL